MYRKRNIGSGDHTVASYLYVRAGSRDQMDGGASDLVWRRTFVESVDVYPG